MKTTSIYESINPIEFAKLLTASEWVRIPYKKEYMAIYQKKTESSFWQITLPRTKDFRNYPEVMANAIDEYARSEGITADEALLIVQYPNSDILHIRINDPEIHAGSITIDTAVSVYDNARKLLTATAMDIISPRITHQGRLPQKVNAFIGNCRFGQTEIGSYIVPVVCPLQNLDEESDNAEQLSLFDDDAFLSDSFTRQVTSRLMDNLGVITECMKDNGDIDLLAKREKDKIISTNFLEAFAELNELEEPEASLDFHISWSQRATAHRSNTQRASFSRDVQPILSAASSRMKNIIHPDVSVFGKIKSLEAQPDAQERKDGSVTIVYIDENAKSRTIAAKLNKEDYDLALVAHRKGFPVKFTGKKSRNKKNTYEEISFSVFED